jgi:hypothetical protein
VNLPLTSEGTESGGSVEDIGPAKTAPTSNVGSIDVAWTRRFAKIPHGVFGQKAMNQQLRISMWIGLAFLLAGLAAISAFAIG